MLIADGVHLHPAMVRLAWAALGPDRLVLVTDAVAATVWVMALILSDPWR